MSDTVKTSLELRLDNVFVDGDTRSITLKNPKGSVADSDIASLNAFMQTTNVIIGDKSGATFGRITKATRIQKQEIAFDLTE